MAVAVVAEEVVVVVEVEVAAVVEEVVEEVEEVVHQNLHLLQLAKSLKLPEQGIVSLK